MHANEPDKMLTVTGIEPWIMLLSIQLLHSAHCWVFYY